MPPPTGSPKLSVIIPTYNRSALLRKGLEQLADQTLPRDDFEIIVADDGSSDDTRAVAESFRDRLPLTYTFQEDLGFRPGAARNAGARLASAAVLVFLDTGTYVGKHFLERHLRLQDKAPHRAIAGYAYGYNPESSPDGVAEALRDLAPDDVVARYHDDPGFADIRHDEFAGCGFDLHRLIAPWKGYWSLNCSMRAADFAAVGGFDEDFQRWGMEDVELGYRLFHHGVELQVSREAWVIEAPQERDPGIWEDIKFNTQLFLDKHREPALELTWVMIARYRDVFWTLERELVDLDRWTADNHSCDVAAELDAATERLTPGGRVAILGSGAVIPDSIGPATLLDFDQILLDRALASGRHQGVHALGVRVPFADQSFDSVVVTSRLAGPWKRWGTDILTEARRIGRAVHVCDSLAG